MQRCVVALTVCVLALFTGVELATANTPSEGVQTADQSASSGQVAGAASGAAQFQPSNTNVGIRVLSPGDDGSVVQTNSVESDADASNRNSADQDATQTQSGGSSPNCCGSGSTGIQSSSQSAANGQAAAAISSAAQLGASNTNVPIRVGSYGDDGSVHQTNSVESDADATNRNSADQSANQDQSSGGGTGSSSCCPSGSTGVQTADQNAENGQAAIAASSATQVHPENTNVSIRVLSPGDGGDVVQTNKAESDADATNSNSADQTVDQTQSGGSGASCCHSGSTGIQTAEQDAKSEQLAIGLSEAKQVGAKNTNVPIRVGSYGDDGSVYQTNSVDSDADASNRNSADQSATQDQSGGGSGSTGIQIADQSSKNEQAAIAASSAAQIHPSNTNVSIRVLSPGDGGRVVQTNKVESDADASNSNRTDQTVDQTQSGGSGSACCHGGSTGIQVAGQEAKSEQLALGLSAAEQKDASNTNAPIRVKSWGDDGSVFQSNSVESDADASNRNTTDQEATQAQSGGSSRCGCASDLGIQVAGQSASNHQAAGAISLASQTGASNENSPLRVLSPGHDGLVVQSNSVESDADATNRNSADQSIDQEQAGGSSASCCHGSLGIQVAGQESKNAQGALALSYAEQKAGRSPCGCPSGASNSNDPVRILSPGHAGPVFQSNSVESDADASNRNKADQDATQTQSGPAGLGIQVAGQSSRNAQLAAAISAALQQAPSNANSPWRVGSAGGSGLLWQANKADSDADGSNRNKTSQTATQEAR
jgi:hypothetical protein